ncbi:AAA family ATPase [Streptomyces turgidiscabies]|nr:MULTISPECIES: LuxR family transcriptional regulator [Streptomyces]MDX3496382.1 AAA family ATPase [Streptomyces turgidiscabies]GAQ75054.1 putative HTH-type transcriptional [Streptomyces turgidiscabies]
MTTERTPLAGREPELGRLDRLLADLTGDQAGDAHGRPAVLDVSGEPGIGKSRLVHELCSRATRRGATVLRGRATEYEHHIPFQPFIDAFADLDPEAVASFPAAAEVAPVLSGAPRHADRFGLHRATAALLTHAAASPLVVVLDDMHWADDASLELLDHLVRHPVRARVLLVLGRRDRQSPAPLAATLTRGADTGAVHRTVLGPLGERECVELLTPDLAHDEAVRLYRASEGNPLYLLSLLQARREGAPVSRLSTTGLDALLLDELTPLTPAQRRLVEAVAVLGDHATPALLGPVTGREQAELAADLAVLTRRDLLRTGRHGRLTLRHPVLRGLVHDGTDPWRRTETHRLAAAELALAGAPPAERAHHAERSMTGWDPQSAAMLTEAAEQASHTAPASCAHWLEVVLRHLPHTPEHLRRRGELMLLRARSLGACGRLRESRDLLHEVMALPDPGDGSGSRTSAVVLCAVMERHLGRYTEAVALLRRELSRTDPAPSPADQVALGLELGHSAPHHTSYPAVRSTVARTLEVARSLGDEAGVAGALAVGALGEAYEGATATAADFARRAAALVDSLPDDDLTGLCEPLARLGWAEAFLERFADAERHADRGLVVARRTGQLHLLPHLLLCKAHVRIQSCRLASAVELADEAEDIARGIGSDELLAFVLGTKAHALVDACPPGDPRPLTVAEEAVAAAGLGLNWWASIAWCALGYAALTAGDPVRAREAMLRAGGPGLHRLQPSMRPLFMEILVTATVVTGDLDEAKEWAERAQEEAESLDLPVQRASAMRSAAHIHLGLGDGRAAAELFVSAADESARSGAAFWQAFSLLLSAPALAADPSPNGARRGEAAWRRGQRIAAAGGCGMLSGLAEAVRPAVADAADGPERRLAELTAREREIAGLVTEGLTSPVIAARLCLSRRTVETHISKIYRKTGVSSRAALAGLMTGRPPGHSFSG